MLVAVTDAAQLPTKRLGYLDGLRASAALFVLVHHTLMMAFPIFLGIYPKGALGYWVGWASYGHFGVTVFIVLAGYSLFLGVARKDGELPGGFWSYMKRRAWRIIPPYLIVLAITIFLVITAIGQKTGTQWDLSLNAEPTDWGIDALLLQDVVPYRHLTAYTFWSVAIEWHIYLLLPIMLFVRRSFNWPCAIVVGAAFGAVGAVAAVEFGSLARFHFEYYLLFALAGGACVLVRLRPQWGTRLPWKSVGTVLAGIVFALTLSHSYVWADSLFPPLDIVLGSAVVCFLISLGTEQAPRLRRVFAWKPLAAIGAFSYTLYLTHAQLLQVFWNLVVLPSHLSRPQALLVGWLVAVPAVVVVAWIGSYMIERPFVRISARGARGQQFTRPNSLSSGGAAD